MRRAGPGLGRDYVRIYRVPGPGPPPRAIDDPPESCRWGLRLHAGERPRRTRWWLGLYVVADSDDATEHDNTHDPGPAHQYARPISVADPLQQAGLERFDLSTGVTKTGDRNESGLAKPKHRSDGQVVDVDTTRRDVLAQLARGHLVPGGGKHLKQLAGDEVNLSEVRLVGVSSDTRAVLHEWSGVGVSSYTDTCNELDLLDRVFREIVCLAQVESHD